MGDVEGAGTDIRRLSSFSLDSVGLPFPCPGESSDFADMEER